MNTTTSNEQSPDGMKVPPHNEIELSPEFLEGIAQKLYAEIPKLYPITEVNIGEILSKSGSEPIAGMTQTFGGNPVTTKSGAEDNDEGLKLPTGAGLSGVDFRTLLAEDEKLKTESPQKNQKLPNYYFIPELKSPLIGKKTETVFNIKAVREDFPILHQKVNGKPLIWLDNAATSQKPNEVIEAVKHYYEWDNSNVHRGVHTLASRATDAYEGAREKVRQFVGATFDREIIFTHGATEAINLVAQTFGRMNLAKGDEILVSILEHHSNIVPWQFLRDELGIRIRIAPIDDKGDVILEQFEKLLTPRTKLVALTQVSNALGTVVPVQTMTALAHKVGAKVLIDGAQSVPHFRVNVQSLDCDFFAFSGHKVFAPTGIGVLFGKAKILDEMIPWQGGGSMIDTVTFEESTFQAPPHKFEAGTPIIAGAVGLGAAIDYLNKIGFDAASKYEHELVNYAVRQLEAIPGLKLIGTPSNRVGVISFLVDGINPEGLGKFLDEEGIAVRVGHHCAMPVMRRMNVPGTIRASLAFYNTFEEIDSLVDTIRKAKQTIAKGQGLVTETF